MTENTLPDLITKLSGLIAAHGVYALTPILIFYVWGQVRKSLDTAAPRDREYFKNCHTWTLIISAVFFLLSSAVWIYATFFYTRATIVRGSMMGLSIQPIAPAKSDDPPYVSEQITPETRDFELFENKTSPSRSPRKDAYDLNWVVLPYDRTLTTVTFVFEHEYRLWTQSNLDQPAGIDVVRRAAAPRPITRRFRLDLGSIALSQNSLVQIVYEPDDDVIQKVGHLFLLHNGNRAPVNWEPDSSPIQPRNIARVHSTTMLSWLLPFVTAFGQSQASTLVDRNGIYDSKAARILRGRLANHDLKEQLDAVNLVVASGKAVTFVSESLKATAEPEYDRSRLISALANVAEALDRTGTRLSPATSLDLADELAGQQDYQTAATLYDKNYSEQVSPKRRFLRGLAYAGINNYGKAVVDFERILPLLTSPRDRAVIDTDIGLCYRHLNKSDLAISHYKDAIKTDPSYARPHNNLAYVYSLDGNHLPEALQLADKALALSKGSDDEPNFNDTKGWVLYRLGRYDEALKYLRLAASAAPYDADIKAHVQEAEKASKGK